MTSAIAFLLILQTLSIFTVQGDSMAPTLATGDRIVLQPGEQYARGDVVAIRFKTLRRPMVKRVVAVGGDRVSLEPAGLRVNGVLYSTGHTQVPYPLAPDVARKLASQLRRNNGRVPVSALIVLGDNPRSSYDSAQFGLVYAAQIIGRAMPVYEAR